MASPSTERKPVNCFSIGRTGIPALTENVAGRHPHQRSRIGRRPEEGVDTCQHGTKPRNSTNPRERLLGLNQSFELIARHALQSTGHSPLVSLLSGGLGLFARRFRAG